MTNGTYAEYIVSNPHELIYWPETIPLSDQELSMFCINPLSVIGLCDIVAERKSNQVVVSAASSNVNKMIVQYLRKKYLNKSIYGLSRSSSHDEELKRLGYEQLFRMD